MIIYVFRVLVMGSGYTVGDLPDLLVAFELGDAVIERKSVGDVVVQRILDIDCIACNWCLQRVTADQTQIRCAVNPTLGREVDSLRPLPKGEGTVVVIGAGPAGIQSALTLAQRGYQVKLFDKRAEFCGSLNLANKAPNKFRMDSLIAWYKRKITKTSNIEVHLNTEVTPELLD